jgi:hypothetical protein
MKCQWCNCGKHAIQYTGERAATHTDGSRHLNYDRPGVCLVCPVCDSPHDAVTT